MRRGYHLGNTIREEKKGKEIMNSGKKKAVEREEQIESLWHNETT